MNSSILAFCLGVALLAPLTASAVSICLDPGHGGSDPGAVGCGLQEDNINLDTCLRLKDLLQGAGLTVLMTRSTDTYVSLQSRTDYANAHSVDRFVSIHSNSADPPGTGIETFCYTTPSAASKDLRNKIQEEMVAAWPLTNRGVKTANFAVLRETNMPATLTELAFINKCTPDAEYLSSTTHRQEAAQAHLQAILRHLGINPVQNGTMMGAVFEDHGSGTVDMSTRLPGAQVTVPETGDSAIAQGSGAIWSFSLPAGAYTFHASLAGYSDAERKCTVTANAEEWCSIGLVKQTPPDAGPVDGGAQDAGGEPSAPDGGTPDSGGGSEEDAVEGGCGCGAAGSGMADQALLLAGLAALGIFARRRFLILAAVLLLGASAGAQQAIPAREVPPFARLFNVQVQAEGDFLAPLLAPDGHRLVFSVPGFTALFVRDLGSGQTTVLSERSGAGYLPLWRADSSALGLRLRGQEFSGAPMNLVDLAGQALGPWEARPGLSVLQRDDQIWLRGPDGERRISLGADRYFAPQLAPDGRHVVYNGLSEGLLVFRIADGRTFALGSGNHPAFSGDGRLLAFDRTGDDGHRLTAGELLLTDLQSGDLRTAPLTSTADRIEQYPSLSGDGGTVAFSAGGRIFTAELVLTDR
jgi:N-acetylmuramoyl-L-alanine amidase